jgi:hypothetical protein
MDHTTGIEEGVTGFEGTIGLAFDLQNKVATQDVAGFVAGVDVPADHATGREIRGTGDDLFAGYFALVMTLKDSAADLGGLVGDRARADDDGGTNT